MTFAAIIALVTLTLTQLGVLVATVWKIATIVADIGAMKRDYVEKLSRVDTELGALDDIPTLKVRVGNLEGVAALVPKHDGAIQVLQSQVGSLREMRRVLPSKPDLGGE